jgi:Flp pilus assembly pilin Flp
VYQTLRNLRNYTQLGISASPLKENRISSASRVAAHWVPCVDVQLNIGDGPCGPKFRFHLEELMMTDLAKLLWRNDEGQDIAEYAVMLAVILVIVIGTVRLIGGNANNVFSSVASSISQ